MNSATSSRVVSEGESTTAAGQTATDMTKENTSNDASQPPQPSTTSRTQEGGVSEDGRKERVAPVPSVSQFLEPEAVPVSVLLNYIRSTFDDEDVLDSLPLGAAGNPGAWHAWRAHRQGGSSSAPRSDLNKENPQARLPGDWHWDGIWAKRVRTETEASHSDQILFGNPARTGGDEMVCRYSGSWQALRILLLGPLLTAILQIRFSRLDDPTLSSIKEMMVGRIDETRH